MRSLKDSTHNKRESWLTFRHRTPFRVAQSNDFKFPWFDAAQIEVKGQAIDTVMFGIRSIEPIEKHVRKPRYEAAKKKPYKPISPVKPSIKDQDFQK